MSMLGFADPNVAFLLLIVGLLAVFWETHAPGLFLPGIAGIVLLAFAGMSLYDYGPTWRGSLLLIAAIVLLGVELKVYTHMVAGSLGALLLAIGAILLLPEPNRISPLLAGSFSAAFGVITVILGYLGMRARKRPLLNGEHAMCRECAIAETDIDPDGTVLVRGEHWRAHSEYPICRGTRVHIQRVQGLTLFVETP